MKNFNTLKQVVETFMESTKYKPSILLSIFKRKGGEGVMTNIISDENKRNYLSQIYALETEELPLLCFKQDELNWLLLTNNRVIEEIEGVKFVMPYSELIEVSLAIQEEFKDNVVNKEDFTRLILKDNFDNRHIIRTEKGKPFQGVYQILHHIATNNKATI
jgi:hypothetical protein